MARPFLYHVYDRPAFNTLPAWASSGISVPRLRGGGVQPKTVYSLKKDMDQLRADGAAKGIVEAGVTSIGRSTEGRELWALVVGKGTTHKVLFTGAHHSREWISVEVPYYVAEYLIQTYKSNPTTDKEKRIKHLLTNRQIWFVPLSNPDGHEHTMRVDREWRANRKTHVLPAGSVVRASGTVSWPAGSYTGVDINRNYATANWGTETFQGGLPKTSRNPRDGGANSIWCGIAPSGEVESGLIDALIRAHKFRASISYHNYGQLLLRPDKAAAGSYTEWVGGGMNALITAAGGSYTYQTSATLYPTSGSLMEFTFEQVPNRPTFTPELRPPRPPPNPDWGFSGLPESEIGPCFLENLPAALALINCAGHNAAAATHSTSFTSGSPPGKCQIVRHCWEVFRGWTP